MTGRNGEIPSRFSRLAICKLPRPDAASENIRLTIAPRSSLTRYLVQVRGQIEPRRARPAHDRGSIRPSVSALLLMRGRDPFALVQGLGMRPYHLAENGM